MGEYWRKMGEYWHIMRNAELERRAMTLPVVCKKAYRTYKAIKPPKCSGGTGCQVCWMIYDEKNKDKL